MTYRGQVKNGIVVLDDAVTLPEGAVVRVDVIDGTARESGIEAGPTLLDRLGPVVGKADGLPPDASKNVDHYLYGHSKQ